LKRAILSGKVSQNQARGAATMNKDTQIAIIGAGLGGLAATIRLQQSGYNNLVLLEKGSRVGGTWAQNTYPGCSCDVPVALYQYSFAPAFHWTNTYPNASEVQAYCGQLVTGFGLSAYLKLNTEAVSAVWDTDKKQWTITTRDGQVTHAGAMISALGQLNRPMTPQFDGQTNFSGTTMHAANWDHSVDLTGKRVGVIGAAASAVQLIPQVAKVAGHLTVFQRTPNYVGPRNDRPIRASEVAMLMSDPVAAIDIGERTRQLTFDTADTFFWKAFSWTPEGRAAYTEVARDHLEKQIADPQLRAKLTPDYPAGCKRFLFADNYYPALCLPHVSLETRAIQSFEKSGIVTEDGAQHALDVIIYATGFEATGWKWSLQIEGSGGQKLSEVWSDGPKAYLGITTNGFPNFFMLYGPHTNLGHNSITYMMEQQINYVVASLDGLSAQSASAMDVKASAQQSFFDGLQSQLAKTVWADPSCNSWYKNADGQITQNWGGSCRDYAKAVAQVVWDDYGVA
jgi:cation diffusion facilitator CzcD-associated flavoprotein CzcO